MADITDLERAVDSMINDGSPLTVLDEIEYWRLLYNQRDGEYWELKDQFDQLIDQLETLLRETQ